jgi:TonB family protein
MPQESASAISGRNPGQVEKTIFGDRRFYSMTMNMPNLNSAGGSWVIRFAELKENQKTGALVAPIATQEVDPGYPAELMRHNISGTVTLYAVIRRDGSVGEVRILVSADDRLDEYARNALLRWRFQPATKNGNAVDLEAIVIIPFKPARMKSAF